MLNIDDLSPEGDQEEECITLCLLRGTPGYDAIRDLLNPKERVEGTSSIHVSEIGCTQEFSSHPEKGSPGREK